MSKVREESKSQRRRFAITDQYVPYGVVGLYIARKRGVLPRLRIFYLGHILLGVRFDHLVSH